MQQRSPMKQYSPLQQRSPMQHYLSMQQRQPTAPMSVGQIPTPMPMGSRSPDMVDAYYLHELMNDRSALQALPKRFMHVERILDQEIVEVRQRLFDVSSGVLMELPEPVGERALHRKKVYIPKSGTHFNYVGRLLGPRGKTLKGIEQDTGCKIMIRGAGSTRPTLFNYSNYDEDNDSLHVVIQCEDSQNRADVRIGLAEQLIENLFAPVDSTQDVLKQKQLLELSLIRGTFKPPRPRTNIFFDAPSPVSPPPQVGPSKFGCIGSPPVMLEGFAKFSLRS